MFFSYFSIKKTTRLCALLILLSITAACDTPPPPSHPLKLGTNVWPGYEPLYLARSLGSFDGTSTVRLIEYSSSSQVIRALRNGLLDAAALTLDEALMLVAQQQDLQIILVTDISNGGDALLGQPDTASLKDISGKIVGVESTAVGAYMLNRALNFANIDRSAIQLKNLRITEHEQAFKNGLVDAIVTFDPVRTKLLSAGAKELFSSRQLPGEIVDVIVVRKDVAPAFTNNIKKLKDGWYQALHYIKTNPREAYEILSLRLKLPVEDVKNNFNNLILPDQKENTNMVGLGENSALLQTTKTLTAIMLKNELLKTPVNPLSLFTDHAVDQNKLPQQSP